MAAPVALEHADGPFGPEELHLLLGLDQVGVGRRRGGRCPLRPRQDRLLHLPQLRLGQARNALGQGGHVERRRRRREDGRALELAPVAVEVLLRLDVGGDDGRRDHLALRAGGIGQREAHHRLVFRLEHVEREVLVVPGGPVVHERLDHDVLEAELLHLLLGPELGPLHALGQGQARPEDVGHVADDVHDLGALEAFFADLGDHVPIDGGGLVGSEGADGDEENGGGEDAGDRVSWRTSCPGSDEPYSPHSPGH